MEHPTDGAQTIPPTSASSRGGGCRCHAEAGRDGVSSATWKEGALLRYLTWRPVNDPYTLLNLVFSQDGFLSRFSSASIQELIDAAAVETDQERRAELYRQLGAALQEDPAAIYLNSLVSLSGVAESVPAWTSRGDDYTLPTVVKGT